MWNRFAYKFSIFYKIFTKYNNENCNGVALFYGIYIYIYIHTKDASKIDACSQG